MLGAGIAAIGVLTFVLYFPRHRGRDMVVAYLALGLLSGITMTLNWVTFALMGLVLAALYIGDHPRFFSRQRTHVVNLDVAITFEIELIRHLKQRLGATVDHVAVSKVDFVNDTTSVEVRYRCGFNEAVLGAEGGVGRLGGERA